MHRAVRSGAELGAEHVGQAVLWVHGETMGHLEHRKTKKHQVMELLLLDNFLPPQLKVIILRAPAILSASYLTCFINHGNGLWAKYRQIQCLR